MMESLNPKRLFKSMGDKVQTADTLAKTQIQIQELDLYTKALKAQDLIAEKADTLTIEARSTIEGKLKMAILHIANTPEESEKT